MLRPWPRVSARAHGILWSGEVGLGGGGGGGQQTKCSEKKRKEDLLTKQLLVLAVKWQKQ